MQWKCPKKYVCFASNAYDRSWSLVRYLSLRSLRSLHCLGRTALGTMCWPNVFHFSLLIVRRWRVAANELDFVRSVVMWPDWFAWVYPFRPIAPSFEYYRIHSVAMVVQNQLLKKITISIRMLGLDFVAMRCHALTWASITSIRTAYRFSVKHLWCFQGGKTIRYRTRRPIHWMQSRSIQFQALRIRWIELRMCRSHQQFRPFHVVDVRFKELRVTFMKFCVFLCMDLEL